MQVPTCRIAGRFFSHRPIQGKARVMLTESGDIRAGYSKLEFKGVHPSLFLVEMERFLTGSNSRWAFHDDSLSFF